MIPETIRCKQCITSAAYPGITFDQEGVCNFCLKGHFHSTEQKYIDKAEKQISELFNKVKGKSEYDAIVCYSGGKDSTLALKYAVEKYKLRVLSFTLDNGFLSPTAFKNIDRVVSSLGVDHYVFKPSSSFYNAVIKASTLNPVYSSKTLTRISSNCNSCISLVNMTALKIAFEKNIPMIIAGFTLGQIPANAIVYKNHYNFLEESRQKSLDELRKHVGEDIDKYYTIDKEKIPSLEYYPHNVNLLCVENITEEQIFKEVGEIGWVGPKDVDGCSSNCQLNSFNNMCHVKTFGYNPYELELSHMIRKGLLTRDEALRKISDQLTDSHISSIMNKLNVDEEMILNLPDIYPRSK